MSEDGLSIKKKAIQDKALDKLQNYFDLDVHQLQSIDSAALKHLHNMARLGMSFEREMNINQRANELNNLRVGKLITENKEEMKKYLKRTIPQYC